MSFKPFRNKVITHWLHYDNVLFILNNDIYRIQTTTALTAGDSVTLHSGFRSRIYGTRLSIVWTPHLKHHTHSLWLRGHCWAWCCYWRWRWWWCVSLCGCCAARTSTLAAPSHSGTESLATLPSPAPSTPSHLQLPSPPHRYVGEWLTLILIELPSLK